MMDTDKTGRISVDDLLAALHILDVQVWLNCITQHQKAL